MAEPSKRKFRTPGKRRKRQYGEGSLYQRADGMWVGVPLLPPGLDGKRQRGRPVYSRDKNICLEKLEQAKEDIRSGVGVIPRKQYTVEEWMRHWVEEIKKPTIAPNAVKTYRSMVNQQIVPAIGQVYLEDLTPDHVRFMIRYVQEATKEVVEPDGTVTEVPKWQSVTAQGAYERLKSALDDALKQRPRLLRENVAALVDRPPAIRNSRSAHTAEQARRVLATALEHDDPLVTLWMTRYLTGLRQGELLGLQEDRIDFDNLTLDVSWQLQRLPLKKGMRNRLDHPDRLDVPVGFDHTPLYRTFAMVRPKSSKTGKPKSRIVPIPVELALMLMLYLEGRKSNRYGLVWVTDEGHPIRGNVEAEAWYAAQDRAGVPRIQGHGTRHTANSLIRVDEATRQQLLGHSSAATNRLYLHANIDRLREGQDELAGLLLPEKLVPASQRR